MTSTIRDPQQIIYPDSDGQPTAENTKQFRWIVTIKENLELLFAPRSDVFVAGDLFWYPVQGNNAIRQAPDVMVVFGRPKGDRGSYRQWEEGDVPPQVVFEILSPSNRLAEMIRKFKFYERYGVQEYYVYDPDDGELTGWLRQNEELIAIEDMDGWVSPQLQIRFVVGAADLEIYRPDGRKFLTMLELEQRAEEERQRAEEERQRAEEERQRAEEERQRTALAEERARLAEDLLARYRDRFGNLE
ncbi:MAG: Uma2 family endonuclease [Elainellaceae cyanobacterium]